MLAKLELALRHIVVEVGKGGVETDSHTHLVHLDYRVLGAHFPSKRVRAPNLIREQRVPTLGCPDGTILTKEEHS